jgi:hypothetical protein
MKSDLFLNKARSVRRPRCRPRVLVLLFILFASCNGTDFIDFEDLSLAQRYHDGNTFNSSGVTVTVKPFQWGNGQWSSGGYAEVENRHMAGGSGQDMQVNNVNLDFGFDGRRNNLDFKLGEYGGNLNIEVNGDFENFNDFADIDGDVIGGVNVSFTVSFSDGHNYGGTLTLSGEINSFAVGGQELWIDDVKATY